MRPCRRLFLHLPCLLAVTGVGAGLLVTGCGVREEMCLPGHYQVLAVNDFGGDCIRDGEEPPAGWARYPKGKVPRYVGDEWDRYWSTRTLDENGRIVALPN
ncbi:hypothetical protein [Streptomyces sp. Caat 7-52]|uniref:SCO0607 family lipoprotein n=1 Tax=Streptomyces sp. Caat 7-52 TaxID=2949637 RepID=UPI002035361B|nr:hypothetical protein [Streptomyces sp. Caat 7-52]